MSPSGVSPKNIAGASHAIEAFRDLVVNLYFAHCAGVSHLLRLQESKSITPEDVEMMGAFATSVYYGSDINESIARLQAAVRIVRKSPA